MVRQLNDYKSGRRKSTTMQPMVEDLNEADFKALGVFFGVIVVFLVKDALLSIALAIVMILGLDPPVSALERRGWGRGKAAMCVLGGVVLVVFVIVVWAARPLWEGFAGFVDKLPGYVEEARTSPVLEDIDKGTDAFQKLEGALADAARNLPEAAINLLGAAAFARAVGRHLAGAGAGGRIVNLSSIAGLTGLPNIGPYNASKAAIDALTRTLAVELGPVGVLCNSVAPGTIGTEMVEGLMAANPALRERLVAKAPLGRIGTVAEAAWPIVFLLTDAASFITGQTLLVDGGRLAAG
jgi:hypothetical protein